MSDPKRPALDEHFCPACGSRKLEFQTLEELAAEGSSDPSDYFHAGGKVAWACNDCGYESDASEGGFPTLGHLIGGEGWSTPCGVDVGRLVRWAVEASEEAKQAAKLPRIVPRGVEPSVIPFPGGGSLVQAYSLTWGRRGPKHTILHHTGVGGGESYACIRRCGSADQADIDQDVVGDSPGFDVDQAGIDSLEWTPLRRGGILWVMYEEPKR